MRSFYYREVIPPDIERRNYLLKKLAFIKRSMKPTKGTQNLIKQMRRQLKAADGKVMYWRCNKGIKMLIGDETTSKKKFLASKDPRFLETVMAKFRASSRSEPRIVHKERYVEELDTVIRYKTIGGVMVSANYFNTEDKKLQRKRVQVAKYPKDKDPYIGIELEYASNLSHDQIAEKLIEAKLQNDVRIMRDASIRVNDIYHTPVEFCILTKWSGLKEILNRLKPIIFDKPQNFSPNASCGFHVHLDMRYDDPRRVFRNLVSMQSVLFNLVAEHRRENKYCAPLKTMDWDEVDEEAQHAHWDAISKYSFMKHETIEVRIHQSTLSLTRIEKWITLLKRIADYKGDGLKLGTFDSEFLALKEKVKIEPELVKYIEERTVMKSNAKVLQKLLADPQSEYVLVDFLDRMLEDKLRENEDNAPAVTGKTNYVGIEVECFSELEPKEVMKLILAHDLEKHVQMADDGSIDTYGGEETYEFRILSAEKQLPSVFKKLAKFFKEGKFETNDSCGLHVHLDMRNRDVEKCYAKLLKFQDMMFPLVNKDRWINEYCDWSIVEGKTERRMTAINYTAYEKHQTIEVRLHHGTTDVVRIQNWVKLLLRAIKRAPLKELKSKATAVAWAGKDKALKSYIKSSFKTSWFAAKANVIKGYNEDNEDYDGGDEDVW